MPSLSSIAPKSLRSSAISIVLGRGADDRHAGVGKSVGEIERRLPAELHDHAEEVLVSCSQMFSTSSSVSGSK